MVDCFIHMSPERERPMTPFVIRELGRILQVGHWTEAQNRFGFRSLIG